MVWCPACGREMFFSQLTNSWTCPKCQLPPPVGVQYRQYPPPPPYYLLPPPLYQYGQFPPPPIVYQPRPPEKFPIAALGAIIIVIILISSIVLYAFIANPLGGGDSTLDDDNSSGNDIDPDDDADSEEFINEVDAILMHISDEFNESFESWDDIGQVWDTLNETKAEMLEAYSIYSEVMDDYLPETQDNYDYIFDYYAETIDILLQMVYMFALTESVVADMDSMVDVSDTVVPKLELLSDYCDVIINSFEDLSDLTLVILDDSDFASEYLNLSDGDIDIYGDYIYSLEDLKYTFDDLIYVYTYYNPEYVPVQDQDIPVINYTDYPEEIIPTELAAFFDTFDSDSSGTIDFGEGQNFYYWVEDNILYRYDDEFAEYTEWGYPVGDGRDGYEYWQSPMETYDERMGDCEDMAILESAFYRYFFVDARIAGVNAATTIGMDHAVCIVRLSGNLTDYQAIVGDMVYYNFSGVYYMLVDNAYSDMYGTLYPVEVDLSVYFIVQEIWTLEEAYDRFH